MAGCWAEQMAACWAELGVEMRVVEWVDLKRIHKEINTELLTVGIKSWTQNKTIIYLWGFRSAGGLVAHSVFCLAAMSDVCLELDLVAYLAADSAACLVVDSVDCLVVG